RPVAPTHSHPLSLHDALPICILFSGAQTLLLDEPTNHLDHDSIVWLREYLAAYSGGLIVISHDVELLRATVNTVFHLDANRAERSEEHTSELQSRENLVCRLL